MLDSLKSTFLNHRINTKIKPKFPLNEQNSINKHALNHTLKVFAQFKSPTPSTN